MAKDTLVIFDCDGVLVDSEIIACSLRVQQLSGLGVDISLEEFVCDFVGNKPEKTRAILEERFNIEFPPDYHSSHIQRQEQAFKEDLKPITGIEAVLERIPYKAVASNGSMEKINTSLSITKLDRFFSTDTIFSSEMVEKGKPNPDLYLYACKQMGSVPERAVVVEDSVFGLQAAAAAGIPAIAFTGGSHYITEKQRKNLAAQPSLAVLDNTDDLGSSLEDYILKYNFGLQ